MKHNIPAAAVRVGDVVYVGGDQWLTVRARHCSTPTEGKMTFDWVEDHKPLACGASQKVTIKTA